MELGKPKVSIATPIYGVENYIERCARSLFEQTYQNIEYIFVDDCSLDLSVKILANLIEEYPERKINVSIVRHHQNRGLAAARNTAIEHATGDYIIHVDSDDWVEPSLVEKCIEKVRESNADIVIYGVSHEYKDRSIEDVEAASLANTLDKDSYLKKVITQRISGTIWGKMIKLSLYRENAITALEGANYAEDYSVLPFLIFYARKIGGIQSVLCHYDRTNDTSYTHCFNSLHIKSLIAAYKHVYSFFYDRGLYKKELIVEKMQIYSWARRQAILSGIQKDKVVAETGELRFDFTCWKRLMLKHKIIVGLDCANLYWLTKGFVLISEKFGGKFRNLK